MKTSTPILAAILAAAGLLLTWSTNLASVPAAPAAPANPAQIKTEQELRAANDRLYAALNVMFTGNVEPMNAVWSHGNYVTDMGPFGGCLTGWTAVGGEFKKEADMKLGGKLECKDAQIFAGTDLGYVVCVEVGETKGPDGQPVLINHRATNIFHRENGQWKLVHHHTDISPQLMKAFAPAAN